jgi:hypothetical protein
MPMLLPRRLMRRPTARHAVWFISTVLLAACGSVPMRSAKVPARELPEPTARLVISEWQSRLADRITRAGGDPAVLAQLPILRSPATTRPAQIVFSVTDIDAQVPERDGYDAFGLLLGKHADATATWYVFVVGTVERLDYRPAGVVDVRLAAMTIADGTVVWKTGTADSDELRRYRLTPLGSAGIPFPAESDHFRMRPCAPSVCVEEERSTARWTLYFDPTATRIAQPRAAAP